MKYEHREHHKYTGNLEQATVLIAWLMGRDYWLEASRAHGEWTVTCAVAPGELPKNFFKRTKAAAC